MKQYTSPQPALPIAWIAFEFNSCIYRNVSVCTAAHWHKHAHQIQWKQTVLSNCRSMYIAHILYAVHLLAIDKNKRMEYCGYFQSMVECTRCFLKQPFHSDADNSKQKAFRHIFIHKVFVLPYHSHLDSGQMHGKESGEEEASVQNAIKWCCVITCAYITALACRFAFSFFRFIFDSQKFVAWKVQVQSPTIQPAKCVHVHIALGQSNDDGSNLFVIFNANNKSSIMKQMRKNESSETNEEEEECSSSSCWFTLLSHIWPKVLTILR